MNASISSVRAWEALDSRGKPTVACRIDLRDGSTGLVRIPSGASTGSHEIPEQRDGGDRYSGNGVRAAVAAVTGPLATAVQGLDTLNLDEVDAALREARACSPQIGGNATLAVSLASLLASASSSGSSVARLLVPDGPLLLPMPMVNIFSGGAHAAGAVDMQDFLVIPEGAESFSEGLEWAARVRRAAQRLVRDRGLEYANLVADEGGLGVRLPSNEFALTLLVDAIVQSGYEPGGQVSIAIDAAASEFVDDTGTYHLESESRSLSSAGLIELYEEWSATYPIRSIEDPLAEDDWSGWKTLTNSLGVGVDLVGDDLFVTNAARLQRGIDSGCASAILIKVNQNGYVSDVARVLAQAQGAKYRTIVSARSGETEDSWLADLAVGWSSGQLKVGSTQRSERTAKWNRLLELEATEKTAFAQPWRSHPTPRME